MGYQERIEIAANLAHAMEPDDDDKALKAAWALWRLSDGQLSFVGDYLQSLWLRSVTRYWLPLKQ